MSVNFYREKPFNFKNRSVIKMAKNSDTSGMTRHILNQDLDHPHLFDDEYFKNRPGMQQVYRDIQKCIPHNASILDAACGNCSLIRELSNDYTMYGVDCSPVRVMANSREFNIKLGFVESLPYEDNVFDAVICQEILEHCMNLDTALSEIKRVLKPGGVIFCQVPLNANYDGPNHVRLFQDTGVLESIFRKCSFMVIKSGLVPYLDNKKLDNIYLIAQK